MVTTTQQQQQPNIRLSRISRGALPLLLLLWPRLLLVLLTVVLPLIVAHCSLLF